MSYKYQFLNFVSYNIGNFVFYINIMQISTQTDFKRWLPR